MLKWRTTTNAHDPGDVAACVRLTIDNLYEVSRFLKDRGLLLRHNAFNSRFFVEYEQPEFGITRKRASTGDWIVVHSDGRIEVVDTVTFHMLAWEMSVDVT